MRPINSDALGEKGERRFAELCADASPFCNKADRDRTGWDFIVEFPFSTPTNELPMDRRPQPPECRAQVKTVWCGGRFIKLLLSSAERLAKLLQPTCIFVLTVDNNLMIESVYCIHIIGDVLSLILKKVRECQESDSTQINKTYIKLDYISLGKKIEVSGKSLKTFIEQISGNSREYYIRDKSDQIANLGVIGNRYSGHFTIEAVDEREIVDVLLGIKTGKLKDFHSTETRWGITLPLYQESAAGELTVTPVPRKGEIIFKSRVISEMVRLKVGIIPPPMPSMKNAFLKFRVFNDFVEFSIERQGWTFNVTAGGPDQQILSLSQHVSLNKVQRILASGTGSMELLDGRKSVLKAEFINEIVTENIKAFDFGLAMMKKLQVIAGVSGGVDFRFSVDDVNSQIGAIDFVYDLISAPKDIRLDPVMIQPTDEFPTDLSEAEILIIGRLTFSEVAMAFCAIGSAKISGSANLKKIQIGHLNARQIQMIDLEKSSFEDFNKDMQDETALRMILRFDDAREGIVKGIGSSVT